jgi:F-type H+-transporting ATPase subunit c
MGKRISIAVLALVVLAVAAPAFAADEATAPAGPGANMFTQNAAKFLAAALVLGLAAFAGAFGQAKAVASACTSMGRNPGAAGPVRITMLLGVAFIESLVIYALVVAFLILGK